MQLNDAIVTEVQPAVLGTYIRLVADEAHFDY